MRKCCYLVAACVVAAAASAYFAADQCLRNPDSLVGRGAMAVYQSVASGNPIYGLSRTFARASYKCCQSVGLFRKGTTPVKTDAVVQATSKEKAVYQQTLMADVLNRIVTQGNFYDSPESPYAPKVDMPEACEESETQETQPGSLLSGLGVNSDAGLSGGIVLNERNFDSECSDAVIDVPTLMAYADDIASDYWTAFWKKIFPDCQSEAAEEAESTQPQDPPTCQEDPNYHHQYPGCPHSGSPYRSCPNTVVCPYSGKSYPVDPVPTPPEPVPSTEVQEPAQDQASPGSVPCDDKPCEKKKEPKSEKKPTNSTSNKCPCPAQPECPKSDCPKKNGVDTMEFRPSDAQQGEFEPVPLG